MKFIARIAWVFDQDNTGPNEHRDAVNVTIGFCFLNIAWQPNDFLAAEHVQQFVFNFRFGPVWISVLVRKAAFGRQDCAFAIDADPAPPRQ